MLKLPNDLPVTQETADLQEAHWCETPPSVPSGRVVPAHTRQATAADLPWPMMCCMARRMIDGMHRVSKAFSFGYMQIAACSIAQPPADVVNVSATDLPT